MNTIHFVIKRLANINKYLEQNLFLEKIALTDDSVSIRIQRIHRKHTLLCKVDIAKVPQSLCYLLLLSNFARNLKTTY